MNHFHINPDIAAAQTIATDFYLSPAVFELSKEKIFASTFQYIGCKDEQAAEINAIPFILLEKYLDEPLLLTKDKEGKLSCMSNVCTHRGNLLVHEACKLRRITCKYHGRQFDAQGRFLFMPEFKEVKDFPTEADDLTQLPIYEFGNLLFTSLNPKFSPDLFFGEISARMAWYPLADLKFKGELTKTFHIKANWALYCENYLEGFHIPFVHQGLNEVLDFGKYTTELFRYSNLQMGIAKEGEASFDLPFSSPDNGKNIAAYYFWVFPNIMLNFYPWGLSLNVVAPLGIAETKVSFYTFVLDQSKFDTGAGSDLVTVEQEDEDIVEKVQIGIKSRFYKHGRYSPHREQGTHHFHSLLAAFINAEDGLSG